MKTPTLAVLFFVLVCAACSGGGASTAPAPVPATLGAVSPQAPAVKLRVFCAGSLIVPFQALEQAYERANPGVDVQNECHGSIQVIRHVTELHEKIDVVATADHALIPMLMYAASDPESGRPYAGWYIRFAGNRLVLAYTPSSRFADEITDENWFTILEREGVKTGLADPRFDASGYRALMALKLAEGFHAEKDILKNFLAGQFNPPVTAFTEDGVTEISVPEILETTGGARLVVRGASIQLLALLQTGDLDYAFEYESVVRQHGLKWVALPAAINLSDPVLNGEYQAVRVKLDFQRFASVKPVFNGEAIGYGITIPSNAPHPGEAARFIAFLLGPEGQAVMQSNQHALLEQITCQQPENMPPELRVVCPSVATP